MNTDFYLFNDSIYNNICIERNIDEAFMDEITFQFLGLDKMEETGILVWNEEEDTYEVTEIGRTLFKRLSLVEGLDDNGIKNISYGKNK